MVKTPTDDSVYIVFDFQTNKIVKAVYMNAPQGPFMANLMDVNKSVHATMIGKIGKPAKKEQTVFHTIFEEEESTASGADQDCSWQDILDSLHIAFMQQETLRFEAADGFKVFQTFQSDEFFFDDGEEDDANEEDDDSEEEGSEGFSFSGSSGDGTSHLGDIRIISGDSEDDSDDEEEQEKKRRRRRRRLSGNDEEVSEDSVNNIKARSELEPRLKDLELMN